MNVTLDNIVLIGSILLFVGLLASRTTKYGIPILLLFLIVGMLAGFDGPGGIYFNDPGLAKFIGSVALSFILFTGGLETKWTDIRPILWQGMILSTFGVFATAVIVGIAVHLLTGFTLLEGLLLGAVVSSTDAAAVFSILRSKSIALKGTLRPLLELESGSNDPMAYFLTIIMTYLVTNPDASYVSLIPMFFKQMIIGAVAGWALGFFMHRVINWIRLEYTGLYSVLLITMMLFTFSFTDFVGGNAFLAVYIAGCYLGNHDFLHKKSLIKHFDGQAWLMQGIMFITLGLLVFPSQLVPYIGIGLLISVVLMLVARPVSVFLSLMFFKVSLRKKLLISWVGLRGAVPVVLATFPLTAGVEKANIIFNLVFFISITSILLQGTSIPLIAKWLRLTLPAAIKRQTTLDGEFTSKLNSIMVKATVGKGCPCLEKPLVELGLGPSITIASIERGNKFIAPEGTTQLKQGDQLIVMAENLPAVENFFKLIGAEPKP